MYINNLFYREVYREIFRHIAGVSGGPVVPDPHITVQPNDQTAALGADAVFSVTAEGTEPITYQWWELK